MQKILYGCGALILNDIGQVLLLLRSKNSRNDVGLWSQPGGEIDEEIISEEIIQNSVKREIKEEIDVDIEIMDFLATIYTQDNDTKWIAYVYLSKVTNSTPQICEPEKHTDLKWFSLDNLPVNLNTITSDTIKVYREKYVK
jgi:8-oxo-dGTP diphosphatase